MENKQINYSIKKSKKAKNLRISIDYNQNVVVTIPNRLNEKHAHKFVNEKKPWILKKLKELENCDVSKKLGTNPQEYKKYKARARKLILERLTHFNEYYNFEYKKVFIKNQKTLWGSCSRNKNLNFNYKLALIPPEHADYVIVHELCHLKEFNHSAKFWELVEQTIPNYKKLRKELKSM